jgi:FkbM family methyltransferase
MEQPSTEIQLEELLSEPISSVFYREKSTFDELAAPFEKSLVLFGAGGLGRKTLAGLRHQGLEPLAFADNNPILWGKEVEGIKVYSLPEAVRQFGQKAAFVVTIWKGEADDTMAERRQQLTSLGCSKVIPFSYLYWKHPEIFLPHYAFDLPHKVYQEADNVRKVFDLWSDDASRREYLAQLRWRMLMDFDGLPPPVKHEIYFPIDLVTFLLGEVFVDCGAYDGDTVRTLLEKAKTDIGKIIAFEPDPNNFQKLQQYASELPGDIGDKLSLYQMAVGACKSKVRFDASGTEASSVGSGNWEVDCVALDEILVDSRPSYIKMDIEGSEMDALTGAKNVIKNYLPVLAICAYHRQDHLWNIPWLIHSLSDQYSFFLRPHLLEVWDLVCYAIPKNRLLFKH